MTELERRRRPNLFQACVSVFLLRHATPSALMRQYLVCLSVCLSVCM